MFRDFIPNWFHLVLVPRNFGAGNIIIKLSPSLKIRFITFSFRYFFRLALITRGSIVNLVDDDDDEDIAWDSTDPIPAATSDSEAELKTVQETQSTNDVDQKITDPRNVSENSHRSPLTLEAINSDTTGADNTRLKDLVTMLAHRVSELESLLAISNESLQRATGRIVELEGKLHSLERTSRTMEGEVAPLPLETRHDHNDDSFAGPSGQVSQGTAPPQKESSPPSRSDTEDQHRGPSSRPPSSTPSSSTLEEVLEPPTNQSPLLGATRPPVADASVEQPLASEDQRAATEDGDSEESWDSSWT